MKRKLTAIIILSFLVLAQNICFAKTVNNISITITSPADKAMLQKKTDAVTVSTAPVSVTDLGVDVTLSANITVTGSPLSEVLFYANGILLEGEITANGNSYSTKIMSAKEPEYIITVSAENEEGEIFKSEPLSFYTNIVLGNLLWVSGSTTGPKGDGSNYYCLVDGINTDHTSGNKWLIKDSTEWVMFDLQEQFTILGTTIYSGSSTSSSYNPASRFIIQYDKNGDGNWTDVPGVLYDSENPNTEKEKRIIFQTPVLATKLRYTFTAVEDTRIKEIEIYGHKPKAPELFIVSPLNNINVDLGEGDLAVRVSAVDHVADIDEVSLAVNGSLIIDSLQAPNSGGSYLFLLTPYVAEAVGMGTHSLTARAVNSLNLSSEKSIFVTFIPTTYMINQLNSSNDENEIMDILLLYEDNFRKIGLPLNDYFELPDISQKKIAVRLLNKAYTASDLSSLISDFYNALALISVNSAKDVSEICSVIEKYNHCFLLAIGNDSSYNKLTDKADVFSRMLLLRKGQTDSEFTDIENVKINFEKSLIIPFISQLYWGELEACLTELNHILELPLSGDYNSLDRDTKNTIWRDLKLSAPSSNSSVRDVFVSLVSTAKNKKSVSTGTISSSSGGGSTYSVKSESTPAPAFPSEPEKAPLFNDLNDVKWAEEAIEALAENGAVNGFGNNEFRPNDMITREQFVKILIEAFSITSENEVCDFKDVDESHWFYKFAAPAQDKGIVNGIDDGAFGIGMHITRQDMAAMIYRTIDILGIELINIVEPVAFSDSDEISDYARAPVDKMHRAGIINGVGNGAFAPDSYATRAEAVKMIYQACKSTEVY